MNLVSLKLAFDHLIHSTIKRKLKGKKKKNPPPFPLNNNNNNKKKFKEDTGNVFHI